MGSSKLDIVNNSYSNEHLPYKNEYINQQVFNLTSLSIFYKDNSGAPIGQAFEPYNITLTIYVEGMIVSEKMITVEESETFANTLYTFSFF